MSEKKAEVITMKIAEEKNEMLEGCILEMSETVYQ